MIIANIDIEIKGDYSWDWQEQEAHEFFISQIKHRLQKCIESSGLPDRTILYINAIYFPEPRKFQIIKSNRFLDELKKEVQIDPAIKKHFIY